MNTQSSLAPDLGSHKLLSASFNQDQGCFTISYENGFRVYNTDPMELNVKREWDPHSRNSTSNNGPGSRASGIGSTPTTPTRPSASSNKNNNSNNSATNSSETGGGIGLAQMLHRTNYLALVGGGRNPKFPQNKVIIWDDLKRHPALSLEFLSPVLNVLLSRTHIIVILTAKVHVFAFSSPPARIASYETADNPHGVAVLANNVLAFPSRLDGQIQIVNLDSHATSNSNNPNNKNSQNRSSSPNPRSPGISPQENGNNSNGQQQQQQFHFHPQNSNLVTIIRAHKGPIRCLALNRNGTIIASASEMGTIIRLHSTKNTALLHEYRRGLDRAIIYSMAFSPANPGHYNQNNYQGGSGTGSARAAPGSGSGAGNGAGAGGFAPLRLAVLSDKNTLHVFDATAVAGAASASSSSSKNTTTNYTASNNNNSNGFSSSQSSLSSSYTSATGGGGGGGGGDGGGVGAPPSVSGASQAGNSSNNGGGFTSFFTNAMQANRRHLLSKLPLMPRYFYSEWSFVSARVEGQSGVLGWPSDDCVVVIWTDSCKWEKYVIVEKEQFHQNNDNNNNSSINSDYHHPPGSSSASSISTSSNGNNNTHNSNGNSSNHSTSPPSERYELIREAWRGFEGLSYD